VYLATTKVLLDSTEPQRVGGNLWLVHSTLEADSKDGVVTFCARRNLGNTTAHFGHILPDREVFWAPATLHRPTADSAGEVLLEVANGEEADGPLGVAFDCAAADNGLPRAAARYFAHRCTGSRRMTLVHTVHAARVAGENVQVCAATVVMPCVQAVPRAGALCDRCDLAQRFGR
jgi:hypothetical protein